MNTNTDEMWGLQAQRITSTATVPNKSKLCFRAHLKKDCSPQERCLSQVRLGLQIGTKGLSSSSLCTMENTPTGRLDFDQTDVKVFRKYVGQRGRGWFNCYSSFFFNSRKPTAQQEQRRTIEVASKLLKVYESSKQGLTADLLPPCSQFLQRLQNIPTSPGPHPPMKPPANFKYSRVY